MNSADRRPWTRKDDMLGAGCAQYRCIMFCTPLAANRTFSGTLASALC
jgi:hypothetical protein